MSATEIGHGVVIGAGTMGHGIAQVLAQAGIGVTLCDRDDAIVRAAVARIRDNLAGGMARGKVTQADMEAALARIEVATDIAGAAALADVIIEAVPEVLALKKQALTAASSAAPDHALIASNTSSLSVADLADGVAGPQRVVGMHFFNPVHIMKLCEVVTHARIDDATVDTARALAERLGKTPITVADAPGFASSRLGVVLGLEAMRMVEAKVATAADIDTAMRLGYGHPMGPLELSDLIGLDVRLDIAEFLATSLGERFAPPRLLREKVAAGKLGKKTGEGFYRWDGKKPIR
ncbi:MAG TPA: 3-hydroxyacyl-CoA dehydrogenase family protein [Kofleriaceae bacterium]|nr:3-hydroxyacyl-CoA dehydrogenase family protein [Kofleriaceae bacterium]